MNDRYYVNRQFRNENDSKLFVKGQLKKSLINELVSKVKIKESLIINLNFKLGDGLTTTAKEIIKETSSTYPSFDTVLISNNNSSKEFLKFKPKSYWFTLYLTKFKSRQLLGAISLTLILIFLQLLYATQDIMLLSYGLLGILVTLTVKEIYKQFTGQWIDELCDNLRDQNKNQKALESISKALSNLLIPRIVIVDDFERLEEETQLVIINYFSDNRNFKSRNTTKNIWVFINTEYSYLNEFKRLLHYFSINHKDYFTIKKYSVPLLTLSEKKTIVRYYGLPKAFANRKIVKSIVSEFQFKWIQDFLFDLKKSDENSLSQKQLSFIYLLAIASDPITTCFTQRAIKDKIFNNRNLRFDLLKEAFNETYVTSRDLDKWIKYTNEKIPQLIEKNQHSNQIEFIGVFQEVGQVLKENHLSLGLGKPETLHSFWWFFYGDMCQNKKSVSYLDGVRIITHLLNSDLEFLFLYNQTDKWKTRIESLLDFSLSIIVDFAMLDKFNHFIGLLEREEINISDNLINRIRYNATVLEFYSGESFELTLNKNHKVSVGFRYKSNPVNIHLDLINNLNLYNYLKSLKHKGYNLDDSSKELWNKILIYNESQSNSPNPEPQHLSKLIIKILNINQENDLINQIKISSNSLKNTQSLVDTVLLIQMFILDVSRWLNSSSESHDSEKIVLEALSSLTGEKQFKTSQDEIKNTLFKLYKWSTSMILDTPLEVLKVIVFNVGFHIFSSIKPDTIDYFIKVIDAIQVNEKSEYSKDLLATLIYQNVNDIHHYYLNRVISNKNSPIDPKLKTELIIISSILAAHETNNELVKILQDYNNKYGLRNLIPDGHLNLSYTLYSNYTTQEESLEEITEFLEKYSDEELLKSFNEQIAILNDIKSHTKGLLKTDELLETWKNNILYGSILRHTLSRNNGWWQVEEYLGNAKYHNASDVFLLIEFCSNSIDLDRNVNNSLTRKLGVQLEDWKQYLSVEKMYSGYLVLWRIYGDTYLNSFEHWQQQYHETNYLSRFRLLSKPTGFLKVIDLYCRDFIHFGICLTTSQKEYFEMLKLPLEEKSKIIESTIEEGLPSQLINDKYEIETEILVLGNILFEIPFIDNVNYDSLREEIQVLCHSQFFDFFDLLLDLEGISDEIKAVLNKFRFMPDVNVIN